MEKAQLLSCIIGRFKQEESSSRRRLESRQCAVFAWFGEGSSPQDQTKDNYLQLLLYSSDETPKLFRPNIMCSMYR